MSDSRHIVRKGDCIYSLAEASGHDWQTIWNHPDNENLRRSGRTPNQLLPGDEVVVHELRPKHFDAATEKLHRFRRKGGLVELRIVVSDLGMPRKGEPYYLVGESSARRIKGVTERTDDDGLAVFRIPASLTEATLVIGDREDRYHLLIGHMDPPQCDSGKHSRLENLGYACGDLSLWDADSDYAMDEFHRSQGLPELDQRKRGEDHERLKEGYGS